jgi:hypothetical protein
MPTKWVTQLLDSGDPRLVQAARTIESGGDAPNGLEAARAIASECGHLGA